MSITENSSTANLHNALLGDHLNEGYINTRPADGYDNESNKELVLGKVDETQNLSTESSYDVSQSNTTSNQNLPETSQNDVNTTTNNQNDESKMITSNSSNASVSANAQSEGKEPNASNNVHDINNNKNDNKPECNVSTTQNDGNQSDKKIVENADNHYQNVMPSIQRIPQFPNQYQQAQIYNMPVINQGIIYYQQPQQANFIMMKPDPGQNVRFGDNIQQSINSLMPRSASVTSIRGTVPIPLPPAPIKEPQMNQQQQLPIPIHPLVQGNRVVSPNISVSASGSSSNINPTASGSAPNISSSSSSRSLHNTLAPPDPTYIEEQGERYGIRCVCKKGVPDGFLIQCDKCNFWLHGRCVCIARPTKDSYICPFCSGRVIRCQCGQNMRYDVPIVQCQRCKYWVHKSCEELTFGIVPQNFICHRCGGRDYLLPKINLKDNLLPNRTSFIECNRFEIMQAIPEGKFRNMVLSDLSKSELSLHETIGRYFQEFAPIFFEFNHEFWKTFVDVFTSILMCDKSMVLLAIDAFAYSLLYKSVPRPHYSNHPTKFGISETMLSVINSLNPKRIEKPPTPVPLYVDQDGHVRTSQTLDDEQFIVDLPGFLMYSDELNADDGIPPTCFAVTDTEYAIDMEGSCFNLAHQFQRSFHFNTVVRIYRLGDDPRVGLFATRLKGPISEEKGKRGPAVQHDMPLILPFDGEIPFNTPKIEWKDRKSKTRNSAKAKNSSNSSGNSSYSRRSSNYNTRSSSSRRKSVADSAPVCNFSLSLLSSFTEDIIPPIPILLLTEREFTERNKQAEHAKTRARNHKIRNASDDE